jgi:hypothetical protein
MLFATPRGGGRKRPAAVGPFAYLTLSTSFARSPQMTPKVFVSSTSRGLEGYRRAATEECIRVGLMPIAMEFFEAMAKGATEGSKRRLDEADLYLGIFAHRYGYIEEGYTASVTECEFDYAGTRGLDRLCFLVQPDHPLDEIAEDETHRLRMQAFKQRIERSLIRSLFTTVDDFRGKVRLALQDWQAGDAKARIPQPMLTTNVVEPSAVNRLTYRARQTPFVGRREEWAALDRFLNDEAELSWLVVSGPGGSGKSRLVQEFCLSAGPPVRERSSDARWRAGFLARQNFDWAAWQPNADTLIAVDYAAERVDEIRAVLSGLLERRKNAALGARVRLLLVERDAAGAWLQQLVGSRSDGYVIEQLRFRESPLALAALNPDELWEAVRGVLKSSKRPLPRRTDVLTRLQEIDPQGRALYAALAADALLSGRDIREWDRERLLRDVLERERQTWRSSGVDERYENLLALATLVGGDTEKILETSTGPNFALPAFREFDRALYGVMTACAPDGDDVPALKPDMVGEFFVLEHVRGRNERVSALKAADLLSAAWSFRGGAKTADYYGVGIYLSPSALILFLTQMVEDFPDHPSTRLFLRKPAVPGADLRYWATMVALGIRRYALQENFEAGYALFEELNAVGAEELRGADGAGGFIRAGLYLLPLLLRQKREGEALDVLRVVREMITHETARSGERVDFAEAAQEATLLLLAEGQRAMVETLIEAQAALILQHADDQNLRLPYAWSLSAVVRTKALDRSYREQLFARLKEFCRGLAEDVSLYVTVAKAALDLCKEYVDLPEHLSDAESMNALIRSLHTGRSGQRLSRFRDPLDPFSFEVVEDDLREIRLCLAESDADLVRPWTRAERFQDASHLLSEIQRVSRPYKGDLDFARRWGWAVMLHAEARAGQGALVQVPKAVEALRELAGEFSDNAAEFQGYASKLALKALLVAREKQDIQAAAEMLVLLGQCAEAADAGPETIADYAEGAMAMCFLQQAHQLWSESNATARQAAWAIRSDTYRQRMHTLGADDAEVQRLMEWLRTVEAAGT